MSDPTERFSSRAQDYARFRPGYPSELVDRLCELCLLRPGAPVAELGSGTGIFTRLLLERGLRVAAVEPNDAMRELAESILGSAPEFTSARGTAESTGLPPSSFDAVVAAQAFHWFDGPRTRAECRRILNAPRRVALAWNERDASATPLVRELEALLREFGTDYGRAVHREYDESIIDDFFGGAFVRSVFPNSQELDLAGLLGRVQSASYVPERGDPRHRSLMSALTDLYERRAERGVVRFVYQAKLYVGELG